MGSQLSIALRGVASRVENISEEEVKDLLHDGDFVDLTERCWTQIPQAWKQTHSGSGKRVYEPLSKMKSPRTLEFNNPLRDQIWGWYARPADFFDWTQPISSLSEHGRVLDPFFNFVLQLEDQALLNCVRWRICMSFIARLICVLGGGDGCRLSDKGAIMEKLVQSDLVSTCHRERLLPRLSDWNIAGKKYILLAEELGGFGAVIYLPRLTAQTWEKQLPATKDGCTLIIPLLGDVRTKANERWRVPGRTEKRTAHDVVDAIFTHVLQKTDRLHFLIENFQPPRESSQHPKKRRKTNKAADSRPNSSSGGSRRRKPNTKETRDDAASSIPNFEVGDHQRQSEEGSTPATVPPLNSTQNSSDVAGQTVDFHQPSAGCVSSRNFNLNESDSQAAETLSGLRSGCDTLNADGGHCFPRSSDNVPQLHGSSASNMQSSNLHPVNGHGVNSTSFAPNMEPSPPQAHAGQAVFSQPPIDDSSFTGRVNSFDISTGQAMFPQPPLGDYSFTSGMNSFDISTSQTVFPQPSLDNSPFTSGMNSFDISTGQAMFPQPPLGDYSFTSGMNNFDISTDHAVFPHPPLNNSSFTNGINNFEVAQQTGQPRCQVEASTDNLHSISTPIYRE